MLLVVAVAMPLPCMLFAGVWPEPHVGLAWAALHMYLLVAMLKHCRRIKPAKPRENEAIALCILLLAASLYQFLASAIMAGGSTASGMDWDVQGWNFVTIVQLLGSCLSLVASSLALVASGRFLLSNSDPLVCLRTLSVRLCMLVVPSFWGAR